MSLSFITTGSFVNTISTPYWLPLQQKISRFDLVNLSKIASKTNDRIVRASFYPGYQIAGTATVESLTTNAVQLFNLAQNGFTLYDSANPATYAPVAITAFTPGTTTVWAATGHTFQVGDNVRVYGLTSAPQFGGLVMTVTAVSAGSTFTTLLDSTGATSSVGFAQKVGNVAVQDKSLYYPQNRVIAKITRANPMVVTTLVAQTYHVGDVVTFDIPSLFGISNLTPGSSGLPFNATVSAVNNAVGTQTVTFANVDSSGFNAWVPTNSGAWPLAASYPFSFPVLVPQGEGNTNNLIGITPTPLPYGNQDVLSFATQNTGSRGILIGAGDGTAASSTGSIIGSSADTWVWTAFTSTQSFPAV